MFFVLGQFGPFELSRFLHVFQVASILFFLLFDAGLKHQSPLLQLLPLLPLDYQVLLQRKHNFLLLPERVLNRRTLLFPFFCLMLSLTQTLTEHGKLLLVIDFVGLVLIATFIELLDLDLVVFIIEDLPLSVGQSHPQRLNLDR